MVKMKNWKSKTLNPNMTNTDAEITRIQHYGKVNKIGKSN